jgi:HAMP domain-containing protein
LLLLDDRGTALASVGATEGLHKPGTSVTRKPVFTLAQTGGTVEIAGSDGLPYVWAAADSPTTRTTGVRIMFGQPRRVLVATSELQLRQGLLTLTGAALLLFAGVWSLVEWGIRRPMVRITSMVRDLGTGVLSARIAQPYASGELGELLLALDSMANALANESYWC